MLPFRAPSSSSSSSSSYSHPRTPSFARTFSQCRKMLQTSAGIGNNEKSSSPSHIKLAILLSTLLVFTLTIVVYFSWSICPASHSLVPPSHVVDLELSIEDPQTQESWSHLRHLIVVAGHAVLAGLKIEDLYQPKSWILLPYQYEQVPTYLAHIERGVKIAREDPTSLLMFTGGETRRSAGPKSEAQSYWMAADHLNWFQPTTRSAQATGLDPVSLRSTTEEYARDSFENLLFSLCRFREVVGAYPEYVTVVGFEFKRARFEDLHRVAVKFPSDRFTYEGIDPPNSSEAGDLLARQRHQRLVDGEQSASATHFRSDPYGCLPGGPLRAKKSKRNPFKRHHAYERSCPEMAELLRWCSKEMYPDQLPWSNLAEATGTKIAVPTGLSNDDETKLSLQQRQEVQQQMKLEEANQSRNEP